MQSLERATPAYVDARQYFPVTPVRRQVWKTKNTVDQFAANLEVVRVPISLK